MSSLMILDASIFEILCGKTDNINRMFTFHDFKPGNRAGLFLQYCLKYYSFKISNIARFNTTTNLLTMWKLANKTVQCS